MERKEKKSKKGKKRLLFSQPEFIYSVFGSLLAM